MIIDTHAHFVPAVFLETLRAERRLFPSVKVMQDGPQTRMEFAGANPTRPVAPRLSDMKARKEWLGAQGLDCQVAGGWLDLFGYELPPEEGADWARFMNETMLKGAGELPAIAPLATVPLQSGALAARVLEEALAAGFRGVMIGTQPKGTHGALDDADLDPFWEVASARKVTIFVHPMFGCGDDRLNGFDLINAVGRATDTITAMARLLYSGHLQRHAGMSLIISHGGGGLPYLLGRLRRNNAIHPGDYADALDGFRRLYFDTVLFDPRALRFLCDCAGADKVVLGSDHPFPIGDDAPVKIVDETPLSAAERRAILSGTAARLFDIPAG
jgi:aminocarboxymuconate-semialdehyde decarboxylase